jgi:acetyl esterase/lipase
VTAIAVAALVAAAVPASAEKGIVYAVVDGRELTLRLDEPTDTPSPRPALLLVHGGGWRRGNASELMLIIDLVVAQGWVAVSPEYRLDVDPGYPAEVDDVARALAFVREHAGEYGIDPARVALLGDSAGGNLALEVALRPDGPRAGPDEVAAAVALSGPTDLRAIAEGPLERTHDDVVAYLGCEPSACPDLYAAASPVSHVDPDDPPVFLANSTDEIIPDEQVDALAAQLTTAGVDVRTMVVPGDRHGHGLVDQVWPDVVTFLQGEFGEPIRRPPHPNTDEIYQEATGADDATASSTATETTAAGGEPAPDGGGTTVGPVEPDTGEGGGYRAASVATVVVLALLGGAGIGAWRRARRPHPSAAASELDAGGRDEDEDAGADAGAAVPPRR